MGDSVELSQEHFESIGHYVRKNLPAWLEETAPATVMRTDPQLLERMVRVEEELKSQRELMQQGFQQIDRRFEVDMCITCTYVEHMSTMIQIRNVPEKIHRRLKARAANEGTSLSDYLLRELSEIAERPTRQELLERLESRSAVVPPISPAEAVREARDSR